MDKFTSGLNGCAECICLNGRPECDESKCQILVDPPEASTEYVPRQPIVTHPPPPVATTTTTTTKAPRSSEKGPSSSDLGYYGSRLTDVNPNSEKGPTDQMVYMPDQYSYLQAQVGSPGLRGPPGMLMAIKQIYSLLHIC